MKQLKNKVLIVDDEKKITRALKFLLEDEYEVYTSNDYKDALDQFRSNEIYMVLLDLRLDDSH